MRVRLFVALLAVAFAMGAAPPSSAGAAPYPDHFCDGSIRAHRAEWGFDGKAIGCDFIRRWTRRWLRHHEKPMGWECITVGETGDCHKRHTHHPRLWFEFYVLD